MQQKQCAVIEFFNTQEKWMVVTFIFDKKLFMDKTVDWTIINRWAIKSHELENGKANTEDELVSVTDWEE